jgi:Helicase HerA, central domain
MASDFEIGRVIAVDTATLTIQLHEDLKALIRSTYEQTVEVGHINSYLVLPVGANKIVAMVTRVFLTEDAELRADKTTVVLPASRRIMKATMIGTLNADGFSQGIGVFSVIDNPVLLPAREDLQKIFGARPEDETPPDPRRCGFCVSVGQSVVFPDFSAKINPHVFFGKHAAVIGSTGSGKSCTIATIIQAVLARPEVKRTRFIVLDTNGEYRSAFQKATVDGWIDYDPKWRALYIPPDGRSAR